MKKFYVLFLAIGVVFSGCGSQDVKPAIDKKVSKAKIAPVKNQKQESTSTTPKWIANPDADGYTGSVGVVKLMKNKKKQNYIAKKLAIAELQERKRVMMSSDIDKKSVVTNDKEVAELTQTIKQTSSHYNSDVIIQKAEYVDDENYYVWMVVEQ